MFTRDFNVVQEACKKKVNKFKMCYSEMDIVLIIVSFCNYNHTLIYDYVIDDYIHISGPVKMI